jgi:GNAT superfamily N-acetyltransferase
MVWVHKSRRGEGIGATLSREAQELAASLGKDTLFVYGQATDAIWDFTGHMSDKPELIEGLTYNGLPVRYSPVGPV